MLVALVLILSSFPHVPGDHSVEAQAMAGDIVHPGQGVPCEGDESLAGTRCAAIGGCPVCAFQAPAVAEPEPYPRGDALEWASLLWRENIIAPRPHPPKLAVTA